jgi:hypothetical protein
MAKVISSSKTGVPREHTEIADDWDARTSHYPTPSHATSTRILGSDHGMEREEL